MARDNERRRPVVLTREATPTDERIEAARAELAGLDRLVFSSAPAISLDQHFSEFEDAVAGLFGDHG